MQTRTESIIEAALNIGSGFILSLIVWQILAGVYDIPMPISRNLQITSIFTVVSLLRSYAWRRIGNWYSRRKYDSLYSTGRSPTTTGKRQAILLRTGLRGAGRTGQEDS